MGSVAGFLVLGAPSTGRPSPTTRQRHPTSVNTSPSHRWFPGYTVVGAATVAYIATAPGQTFVLSQLNAPLREAFGVGALTLNTSYALATVLGSLPLVLVGAWTDRVGPRIAMAGTAFAFGLACLVMSAVTGFWMVVVAFFLLRFLGQGALSMISQHATAMWFHRRLGTVHGVKQVVVFGVWVLFPQMALLLITALGWRWTYIVFAGAIWISVIPLSLLAITDRPEDLGLAMDDDPPAPSALTEPGRQEGRAAYEPSFTLGEAVRTRSYWILSGALFVSPLVGTALLFDIQPIVATRGMGASAAATAVSAWTGGMALMAVPAGRLTDRAQPAVLIPVGLGAIAASSAGVWWAPSPLTAAAAMLTFAIGQTLVATSATTAIARYFGRRHHGAIRSSIVRMGVIGTGLGPVFTGISADRTGGYLASTAVFVLLCLLLALLSSGLRAPPDPTRAG